MFADFRRSGSGTGTSFKGALAYFLHDKAGPGEDHPTTTERVDVLELRNLATDDAHAAWFEMMNTAEASEALKAAAGVRKGGRAGGKPVFAYYLAWHDSETPDRATMLDAARSTLKRLGVQDHQALIVAHTDTASPHVHVVVNRVNPHDGRYAPLSNSWKELKAWAIDYSKERGTDWHVPLEQAKEARQQRSQTERQQTFNAGSAGRDLRPAPEPAQTAEANAEATAADALRVQLREKWQAFRQHEQGREREQAAERSRFWDDRKAQRAAIYTKYEEAYQAIWKPEPRQPAAKPPPLPQPVLARMQQQRRRFERREKSIVGRFLNARALGQGRSLLALTRLALNEGERRQLFDQAQRKTASEGRWGKTIRQEVKAAWVPETRRMKADRLKVMRADELKAFDQETQVQRAGMTARHGEQKASLTAMKAQLSAEGRKAWGKHAQAFHKPTQARGQGRDEGRAEHPETRAETAIEPTRDRFGRNRDRKPRQPRERSARTSQHPQNRGRPDAEKTERRNNETPTQTFERAAKGVEDHRARLDRAEAAHPMTHSEWKQLQDLKAREAVERSADRERGGRER